MYHQVVNDGPNIALATNLDLGVFAFPEYHGAKIPRNRDCGKVCQTEHPITEKKFRALKLLQLDPMEVFKPGFRHWVFLRDDTFVPVELGSELTTGQAGLPGPVQAAKKAVMEAIKKRIHTGQPGSESDVCKFSTFLILYLPRADLVYQRDCLHALYRHARRQL